MPGDPLRPLAPSYASSSGATPGEFQASRPLAVTLPWRAIAWLAALIALTLATQYFKGAYRAELGNYSDESAHFMNGLLVRDYLTHAIGENPLAFAESYYISYPKIAPLVWPPFFHGALGLFLLPAWPPHAAALVFVALIGALTAFRLWRFVGATGAGPAALLVPILFLTVPVVQELTTAVMVDIALAALGLEAAWWLTRYAVTREPRHAALFGLCATCCCLTKGNGVAVTLLPPLLILATGRVGLLRTRGLYAAAAMVALLAGPFVYISYRLCDAMGDFTGTAAADTAARLRVFTLYLWHQLTPLPAVLAVIGAAGAVYRAWTWAPSVRTVAPAALVALAAAAILFHTLLPLEYYSGRYVAMSVAPLLGLVPAGAATVIRLLGYRGRHAGATAAIVAVAGVALLAMKPALPARRPLGFAEMVGAMAGEGLAGRRILVISDEEGEGALVTEVAIRQPSPAPIVIRGSKLLVEGDWLDNNLRTLYGAPADTMKQIEDLHVDYVVLDDSSPARQVPFWPHMKAVTRIAGPRLSAAFLTHPAPGSGPTRPITVYRVTHPTPGPPARLRVNLRYSLGKVLEK